MEFKPVQNSYADKDILMMVAYATGFKLVSRSIIHVFIGFGTKALGVLFML